MKRKLFLIAVALPLFGGGLLLASPRLRGELGATLVGDSGVAGPSAREGHPRGAAPEGGAKRAPLRRGLREAQRAMGDRLVKPGRERVLLSAVLRRGDAQEVPVQLAYEIPGRLRLDEGGPGLGRRTTLVFDGQGAHAGGRDVGRADLALVETILRDSAEHLFRAREHGGAIRFVGSGFRLEDNTDFEYAGPSYDLYELAEPAGGAGGPGERVKLFFFNAATHLLEEVRYEAEGEGGGASVVVRVSDWQDVDGQRVPGRVVRLENGEAVFDLRVTGAAFAPRAADATFDAPRN